MLTNLIPVSIATLTLMITGCNSNVSRSEAGIAKRPASVSAAALELRNLKTVIIDAMQAGNPAACDEELHAAMYLAEQLPDIARETGASDVALTTITDASKQLLDLFMAAHDSGHGGENAPTTDEFAKQTDRAFELLESAIDNAE